MSCPDCFSGHTHDGAAFGTETVIHGRNTYVSEPPDGSPAKAIIIIVPDAFGWKFPNNRILADHYAARGQYKVYLPDFNDGLFNACQVELTARPLGTVLDAGYFPRITSNR
jgi:hypothetical protein